MVLSLQPGKNLLEWIELGEVSEAQFLQITIEVLKLLEKVHRLRLIHCDIKPENIIVDMY